MPEYLSPGVYVEETSYRAKSIEGVATSTAGFVGQSRFGLRDSKIGLRQLTDRSDHLYAFWPLWLASPWTCSPTGY